jgi:hypothetical protein
VGIVPTHESDLARFWEKVDKHGPVPDHSPELGPCWLWLAGLFGNGYGIFRLDRKLRRAHIVSYEWHVGPTNGLQVQHACNVKRCVNPAHLSLGDQKQNIEYARSLGRMATGVRSGMHTHDLTILSDDEVREIHRLASEGVPQDVIAEQFGVTQTMVSHIARGERWRHLGLEPIRTRAFKPRPSDDTVRSIRAMVALGIPYTKIGAVHGCSASAVWRIANRLAYADVQ